MSITLLKDTNNVDLSSGIVAIHAAIVPTPNGAAVVYFGTDNKAFTFDPDQLQKPPVELATKPGSWAFCSSHAFLQDGRWVISGGVVNQDVDHHGHKDHDSGERRCALYSPLAGTFAPIHDLNFQPNGNHGGGRWYPTTLTLSNGEAFVVAGHPFAGNKHQNPEWNENQADPNDPPQWIYDTEGEDDYEFAPGEGPRHNNNTPERYNPGQDFWTQLVADSTSHDNGAPDEYPRLHLAPSGHVFFSTIAKGDLRFYDPYTGKYNGTTVGSADTAYHHGSGFSSVLLPILPGDLNQVWVLACGSTNAQKVNLMAAQPSWEGAGALPQGKARVNACATILPTGNVFINGGELEGGPLLPPAELYSPSIDWVQGQYTAGTGSWKTLDTPSVKRGYHNVALLLPDGRVWLAGSTWSDWKQGETRMEVYTPTYIQPGRVKIQKAPPSAAYGSTFKVTLSASTKISRAVLMRCGSVTHAFDNDQRCVVCSFSQAGNILTVSTPEGPGLAPPGTYMLFILDSTIVDGHGRPCERAALLRICDQSCTPVNNHSSYSLLEVNALKSNKIAVFPDAVWLFLDNFRPHEAGFPANPSLSLTWDTASGTSIPSNLFSLAAKNPWMENDSLPPDLAQRFAFRYDVQVHEDAYLQVNTQRDLFVTWDFGHFTCSTMLRLTTKPNPYMIDVQGGNPHWLSTDLRVFSVRAGATPPNGAPSLGGNESAVAYLAKTLNQYNAGANDNNHPFLALAKGQDQSAMELRKTVGGAKVFNFAVAKVRYVGQGQDAEKVRVFFRMFNTVGTALEFDTKSTYIRSGSGPDAVPLIGHTGPAMISIPFFEQNRVTPGQSMTAQPADTARSLTAGGAKETTAYFGAWLDINQDEAHIPPLWIGDGPYNSNLPPLAPESIKGLVRNYHQCLVAEIHYGDDPIPDLADPNTQLAGTPANNDNLSQRNLAWVPVGNPGSAATRTAQTTFLVRSSGLTPSTNLLPTLITERTNVLRTRRLRKNGPDELIFDGSQLPRGARVVLYMPDVSAAEVVSLATRRSSPVKIAQLDAHTLAFELNSVAYLPLPGGRSAPIPGLLSLELPPGIKAGERYRLNVHQLSGSKHRVVGSFQLELPVAHEPELLEDEAVKLSILRWVATRIPAADIWRPIFERYLGEIADRVSGFGGDPDKIGPSPNGDGQKPEPRPGQSLEGKVAEVHYDCCGDFVGFVLSNCSERHVFESRQCAVEKLVLRACHEHQRLAIRQDQRNPRHIQSITILCTGC